MHPIPRFLQTSNSPVGAQMRELDWRASLGHPADWPPQLQTVVSIVLHSPTPMSLLWGPQLWMLYNDAFTPMLGARHPHALGLKVTDIWPDLWPALAPPIEAALAGRPVQLEDQEFQLDRGRGLETAWFSFSYTPVYCDERIGGLLCCATETTGQVLARRRLTEDQERLQTLFQQMPGMVGVVRGPDHVFEIANQALRALYGHRPLVGRAVREALPELIGQGFPELLDRVYATGVAHEGRATPALLPATTGSGMERRYFDFMYQPLRDAEGRVTGIFSQGIDVTEAALATQKLQQSEAWFRLMADAVPQIIWITDSQGRAEFFNRQWADYTGQKRHEEPMAQEVADNFVHPEDAALTMERFEAARRSKATFSVEHRIRGKDGSYRWFLVRAEPQLDPETGEVLRWFGSSTDVSALKDAEAALQLADRRKDEFLATLSHELRNPLAPIVNSLALLRSPKTTEQARERVLDVIDRQTRHVVRLVNDLLEVSRITRGKIDLQPELVDLRGVAQASLDAAASAIQDAGHKVALRLPPQALWVQVDPARLKQVIDNLIGNAIKYTPQGGSIDVEVEEGDDRTACIRVRDNGVGIPTDMLDDVFELFAQVDHSIGRGRGGLGIGLALVKQLVALHGGAVQAASDGIGTGATFTVVLPRAPASAPAPEPVGEQGLPRTSRPRRVLVIDDNRDAADSLASAIGLCGHLVETAYDGPAGLKAAERMRPHCVLLDVGMPTMDGHDVARALRNKGGHEGCLIVAVTGWGQARDRDLTREAGFDAHFVKPAPINVVLEMLENATASD